MSNVTYDGEPVVFNGPTPSNIKNLVDVMTHAAASNGRMLLSVKVNGREILGGPVELPLDSNTQVDVRSCSQKDLYLSAIDTTLRTAPNANTAIDPIVESLLCEPWNDAFNKLNAFMQNLSPVFELMENLVEYTKGNHVSWKGELDNSINAINSSFAKILRYCETQQVAELSSLINFEFRPAYVGAMSLISGTVRDTFTR